MATFVWEGRTATGEVRKGEMNAESDRVASEYGVFSPAPNVAERERNAFVTYAHDPQDPRSLRTNDPYSLLEDRAGDLWVGVEDLHMLA